MAQAQSKDAVPVSPTPASRCTSAHRLPWWYQPSSLPLAGPSGPQPIPLPLPGPLEELLSRRPPLVFPFRRSRLFPPFDPFEVSLLPAPLPSPFDSARVTQPATRRLSTSSHGGDGCPAKLPLPGSGTASRRGVSRATGSCVTVRSRDPGRAFWVLPW